MDILATIRKWAGGLAETVVSLMALAIVLQILMGTSNVPFIGQTDVIGNVSGILAQLGSEGPYWLSSFMGIIFNLEIT